MPTRLRPVLLTLAGLAAAVALTACGGASSDDDAAAPAAGGGSSAAPAGDDGGGSDADGDAPDPCSLTTAADLSAAYGVEFGEGARDDSGPAAARGFKVCTWKDASEIKSFVLQTVATSDDLGQSASELYDQSVDLYPGGTDAGVGDKSVLLPDEGGFLAVQGDVFVQGNPIFVGGDVPTGASKTVLEAVVGTLG